MGSDPKIFKKQFATAGQKGDTALLVALGHARARVDPKQYDALVATMRSCAPRRGRVTLRKPRSYSELTLIAPIPPLDLTRELLWTTRVLREHRQHINSFYDDLVVIQANVEQGAIHTALARLSEHLVRCGWSYWAAELKFALVKAEGGQDALKKLTLEMQKRGGRRVPGLIASMLGDRNDDTFSFDAFVAKCHQSTPGFRSDWLSAYFPYRAMTTISDPLRSMPVILAADFVSSTIDHFEALIECLHQIRHQPSLEEFRPNARAVASELVHAGFNDHRLTKILISLGESVLAIQPSWNIDNSEAVSLLHATISGRPSLKSSSAAPSGLPHQIVSDLSDVLESGIIAQEQITRQIKTGVNLKSLPLGPAIAERAMKLSSGFDDGSTVSEVTDLVWQRIDILAILGYSCATNTVSVRQIAMKWPGSLIWTIVEIMDGRLPSSVLETSQKEEVVWLVLRLIDAGRNEDALAISRKMQGEEQYWNRQCAKLAPIARAAMSDLSGAFEELLEWVLRDIQYAYELPVDRVLRGRKWAELKSLDPILVGLITHYGYTASENVKTRYLCRMACRSFFKAGGRQAIEAQWGSLTRSVQLRVVAFFRDVWIDDNLAMVEEFDSTQRVRQERLSVLQLLLVWDPDSTAAYTSDIKQLTFDETLWRGLKQINQTRIFVNEPAITRWAEKELLQDFERWKILQSANDPQTVSSEIFREYFLNPDKEKLLKSIPDVNSTESNTLVLSILERLLKRFLTDETDGLDSYLSARVRHGTLRGTLLGPLEQETLLVNGVSATQAFVERWQGTLWLDSSQMQVVVDVMSRFCRKIVDLTQDLVLSKVQVQSEKKPNGYIPSALDKRSMKLVSAIFGSDLSFPYFIGSCYGIFWKILQDPLKALSFYVARDYKEAMQSHFAEAIQNLRDLPQSVMPLITVLRTVATATQSECDAVSEWFNADGSVTQEVYPLGSAIEIAKRSTQNVYRAFRFSVRRIDSLDESPQLTTYGLAILTDCLYVAFENAWKHSGCNSEAIEVQVECVFDASNNVLGIRVCNPLSDEVRVSLSDDVLQSLKRKYLEDLPKELIAMEGGSGFAKLARAASTVSKDVKPKPLTFGVSPSGEWFVEVAIQLYKRDGGFDAY